MRQNFTIPFIEKKEIAQGTYSFIFDRSSVDLDFIAGQYNKVTVPHDNPDDLGMNRFFSITESPNNKKTITIITKIHPEKPSSFKKTLFNLISGSPVSFYGPIGNFVLQEEAQEHVFLVGGIGITPFLSIARFAVETQLQKPLTLLASYSRPEEIILKDELKSLSQKNPHIKIVYTITHPEESNISWNGETGRISEELIKKYVPVVEKPYYYVVGPPPMVDATLGLLRELNISQEKIIKESFTGY